VHQVTVCSLHLNVLWLFHAIPPLNKDVVMVLANLLDIVLWSTHVLALQFVVTVVFAPIPPLDATWWMDVQSLKCVVTTDSALTTELLALPFHPMAAVSLALQLHTNAMMDHALQINLCASSLTVVTLQHHKDVLRMAVALQILTTVQQILLQTVTHVQLVLVFLARLFVPH
jgi:hypothetical protein